MRSWHELGGGWAWMSVPSYGETRLRHLCLDGIERIGFIEESHEIVSEPRSPLTVTPSIICECGAHGFVTEGAWVPIESALLQAN